MRNKIGIIFLIISLIGLICGFLLIYYGFGFISGIIFSITTLICFIGYDISNHNDKVENK